MFCLPAESEGSPIHNHSWSPDGRLAFVGLQEDERGTLQQAVYTVNADGSDRTIVLGPTEKTELSVASNLAWSPDGRRIGFLSRVGGAVKLYTMVSDGSDLRETAGGLGIGAKHGSVSWSSDGSRILISKDKVLYVGNADGSNLRRVGTGSRSAWSPDGSRAALYTMAPDGSDVRILVRRRSGYLQGLGPEERHSIPDIASCSAGVVVPDPEANPGLVRDCETLVEITDIVWLVGTDLNWNASTPIADWQGVTLGDPLAAEDNGDSAEPLMPLRIKGLSLAEYEPLGLNTTQLERLSELRSLALTLRGPIPREFGGLTNLQKLSIHGSIGPIPPWLANLENLQELHLGGIGVSGPIPPELGRLSALRILDLHRSGVSGSIPAELGNLTVLQILDIRYTDVKGSIPAELGSLPVLEKLRVEGVHLSGCIPRGLMGKINGLPRNETNVPIMLDYCEH